jgi:hypothetical protein
MRKKKSYKEIKFFHVIRGVFRGVGSEIFLGGKTYKCETAFE